MLLVRIVLGTFKRWGFMLIFSAEHQNHINVVLLALFFLSLLKHIKCDSTEFCAEGKEKWTCISVYMYIHTYVYVKTVDACVVTCGEDGTSQEFTGREQGLVNTK
jgi:hypothetical protein